MSASASYANGQNPDGAGPGGLRPVAALAARTLREDITWGLWHLIVNGIGGSPLLPRPARALLYRLFGYDVRTLNIFDGCRILGRNLSIGEGTFVNRECYFEAVGQITIGTRVQLAMQTMILTSDHPVGEDGRHSYQPEPKPVTIGDRCWIGARVLVLPGVTIGDDVTIAAGATVNRDCLAPGVYAGAPARLVRPHGSPETI